MYRSRFEEGEKKWKPGRPGLRVVNVQNMEGSGSKNRNAFLMLGYIYPRAVKQEIWSTGI